jgi:glycosyltransferase involved in cell wall biosynthesis
LRIALVFEFGSLNGGEHSMLAVMDQLRNGAVEFVALCPPDGRLKDTLEARGIEAMAFDVRDAEGQRRDREELLAELHGTLTCAKCDLVHANSLSMGRLTGAIAERLSVPVAAHLRDILKLSGKAIADLNGNTRLIAVSNAARRFHIAQGMDAERVITLYNGVDCERFMPRSRNESRRRELGLSLEDFLILNVGQIGLRKGQGVLADAAVMLAGRLPNAHYLIAGQRCSDKRESWEFEANIIAKLQSIGEGNSLHLLGYRDDMPELMNAADVLVHPAKQEPLGRVLLEAAASGLPIIATDVGGTREILRDRESAILVPPGDPQALADAILEMANDAELRSRLAETARLRIRDEFSIETAALNLLALWASLLR